MRLPSCRVGRSISALITATGGKVCSLATTSHRGSIRAAHEALNFGMKPLLSYYGTKWHNLKMKRVFKTRHFSRWMRKTELTNGNLCAAVAEMAEGLIDAELGGGVVKKRIGLAGRGKRGGARTLVATNKGSRWFFVYGFEKNDRATIAYDELEALQSIAKELLARSGLELDLAARDATLEEICHVQNH